MAKNPYEEFEGLLNQWRDNWRQNPKQFLEDAIIIMNQDFEKFYDKGQNAAGTRLRKYLLLLINRFKEMRKEILTIREERKKNKNKK